GVRVYMCSVVVGPTHPICSMIYGSAGATHFDQLAKILTGYEIIGARSRGIFMGILSIAVGFLFKITADLQIMFEPMFKQNPSPGWKECPPSSDKVSTSPRKARRREGDAAGKGKGFWRSRDFLSWPRMAYGACYLKGARFFDRGAMIAGASPQYNKKFWLGPGKRWQQQKRRGPSPKKTPSPSDSIFLLTLYMWAPDIYEGSPTPVTAFLSIAPKISISANILRVSICIASMILGALAAMAQTKVKRPLAHSSIGHVGYVRTGFSFSALRKTRVKYIADLGALAKTNPISAITFSITMFSYAGIPPLAGFCSKFYLFFAALGCGAYFLAPLTESVATPMGMHATKDRVESDTSTVYSISLVESTITTRDEPWFGELKFSLGVIGLPVTARDRIMRCSPPVVGTTRAGTGLDSER
ncbi:hypothetical protein EUTSA_v10015951mg, partial [Eutrema salsugineum]